MHRCKLLLSVLGSLIIFAFLANPAYGLWWPIGDGVQQQRVTSTFGEYRDVSGFSPPYSSKHFHDGVDISGPRLTGVYGAEVERIDTIWAIDTAKHQVRTMYHDYFHIDPRPGLEEGDTAWCDVLLGYTDHKNHLHFTSELYNDEFNDWGHEYNPLLQLLGPDWCLQPFSDTSNPIIHWIKFVRDGDTTELSPDSVAGSVDILVKASDSTSCSDTVMCPDANNGVFTVSYSIDNSYSWT